MLRDQGSQVAACLCWKDRTKVNNYKEQSAGEDDSGDFYTQESQP